MLGDPDEPLQKSHAQTRFLGILLWTAVQKATHPVGGESGEAIRREGCETMESIDSIGGRREHST